MTEYPPPKVSPIPVTLVTGFLGSGKTTLLLNLLPQLPSGYRLAFVKNELGDTAVDSQLASQSGIEVTKELAGGCICCNLTGQLDDALETLADKGVERIVVETSGSAFPATLAMTINRLSKETGRYALDGVVSVIDVVNWKGYEDKSYTAQIQAKYTDLIILSKWEEAGEQKLDVVLDLLGDLEVDVAKVKSRKGWVAKEVLLGLDSRMAKLLAEEGLAMNAGHGKHQENSTHQSEVEVLSVILESEDEDSTLNVQAFRRLLTSAPKDEVYRIKAILRASEVLESSDGPPMIEERPEEVREYVLNWAFGRWTSTAIQVQPRSSVRNDSAPEMKSRPVLQMTMVFARHEAAGWEKRLKAGGIVELRKKNSPFDLRVTISR